MPIANKSRIHGAILSTLKPIARLLMRNSVGAREFCELAKTAFVDVATETYGLKGRPTNISRTAVLTDLTRKEVRRIRHKLDSHQPLAMPKASIAGGILKKWTTDPTYLHSDGEPKSIPLEGPPPSFSNLVHQAGGDIPPGAILTELTRIGAIAIEDDSSLSVQNDLPSTANNVDKVVSALTNSIEPVCQCVAYNLENEQEEQMWPTITIESKSIRSEDTQRFHSISSKYMAKLKTDIENLFLAYETIQSDEKPESGDFYVSITVFHTESRKMGKRCTTGACKSVIGSTPPRRRLHAERLRMGSMQYVIVRLSVLLLLFIATEGSVEEITGKVVGITDGDTLTVLVGTTPTKVRLAEIDTPEMDQPFGDRAKQGLSELVFGKPIRVVVTDRD